MLTQTRIIEKQFSFDDLDEAVALINLAERSVSGHDFCTAEELRTELAFPGYNMETDVRLFIAENGKLIGYSDFWGASEPYVRYHGFGRVHPDYTGQGVGTRIMTWLEERALKNIPLAPEGTQVVMHNRALSKDHKTIELFKTCGHTHVRSSYRMGISFEEPPIEPVWPDGIEIRAIQNDDEDLRKAIWVDHESFQDHWGFVPEPFETFLERFKHWIEHEPNIDLSACYLALEGEEPVGVSINALTTTQYPEYGWVNTLGVRKRWRKRGIGLALLRQSFAELYRRGRMKVGLGVDTENLSGALKLYEQAGMVVESEYYLYEKVLRPGKDLMTR